MPTMHNRLYGLLLACAGISLSAGTLAATTQTDFSQIDKVVAQHMQAGDIPGAVVLLQQRGKVLFWEAKGAADPQMPSALTKDSIFWIASLTKPIVATAILTLADAGKLSLSDPVSKYIPAFSAPRQVRTLKPGSKFPPPMGPGAPAADPAAPPPEFDYASAKREITLKDLLTHTSGLQVIGRPNTALPDITAEDTLATWVPKLAASPLEFQPGEQWGYSNAAGFDVLARVVEIVSGEPFDQFLQNRLFTPLRMTSTGFRARRAELMSRDVPLDPRMRSNPCIDGATFLCGSAGLWSSVADYAKFAQMLLDEGKAPNGHTVLKPETVKRMSSDQIGKVFPGTQGISGEGAAMGLGVLLIKMPAAAGVSVPAGSFGWDGVGTRRFWVMPENKVVLVMFIPAGKGPLVQRDIEAAAMQAIGH